MPTPLNKYRIKDLPKTTNAAQLLSIIIEAENATTDQSYSVGMPLVIQTVADNLPASKKVTRLLARTYDTTDPNYLSGDPTLVSQSLASDLVMHMTAGVEFPNLGYRLKPDPNGPFLAYRDTTFTGPKLAARWVIIGSADDNGYPDFSPFTAVYPKGMIVKYTLGGQIRFFSARQELVAANIPGGQQPAPTGLATDQNWAEVNGELAPNFSRLGTMAARYYTNAERAADPYPVGDTVEDIVARENAGAGLLYTNREVTVELGPQAGRYRVVFANTGAEFLAYVDGACADGKNPSKWEKMPGVGSIELTGITENIGGFNAGDSFQGDLQAFAEKLLIKYQVPGFYGFTFDDGGSRAVLAGTQFSGGPHLFAWGTNNTANVLPNSINIGDTTLNSTLIIGTENDGGQSISVPSFTLLSGQTKTFVIEGQNTSGGSFSTSLTLTGTLARFYGASTLAPADVLAQLQNGQPINLAALSLTSDLNNSIVNNITADCSGGKYVYFLYNANLPNPTTVRAGLNTFSAYTIATVQLTDQLGNPQQYKVLYTGQQFGSAVNVNIVS
jgi:hypothetical protein